MRRILVATLPVLAVVACATTELTVPEDVDSGGIATGDATSDATTPSADTGQDARVDAGVDAIADTGTTLVDSAVDPDAAVQDVQVVITCDNAYGFGWGSTTTIATYNTAPASVVAADIFNCPVGKGPEAYTIPAAQAPPTAYLYVVAWADHSVTQGLIGQFKRGSSAPLYTGDLVWEVCATGLDYNTSIAAQRPGPPLAEINAEIVKCNNGTGSQTTSSAGWVNSLGAVTPGAIGHLAIGEDNSASTGNFPIACQPAIGADGGKNLGIDPAAKWMWYTSVPAGDAFHFSSVADTRPFLIFRLVVSRLPP